MIVKTVQGNLLDLALVGKFDVVVHGCNCQCRMGKGIALSIKNQFPEAYRADLATMPGDRNKLGSFSCAEIVRGIQQFTIVNAYTQFHWQGTGVIADYEAIRLVFGEIRSRFTRCRIGYPKIGAGLAGGDWDIISGIIREELSGENHTYVEFIA